MRVYNIRLDLEPTTRTASTAYKVLRSKDGRHFVGKKQSDWLCTWLNAFNEYMTPHIPDSPKKGSLRMELRLAYPYRKSEKKIIVNNRLTVPKLTKPDCDNAAKAILDEMTAMKFWEDDKQIYHLTVMKVYEPEGSIEIKLTVDDEEPF